MRYRDVVIHTNEGRVDNEEALRQSPPIQGRVDLSDQIWVGRLDLATSNTVLDTCATRTFGIDPPRRQFAQLYSFVRELPSSTDIFGWDEDSYLTATVALSRLVHPTSTGLAYAARVAFETEVVKWVFPAHVRGISVHGFLSPNRTRDWLTESEVGILKELGLRYPLALPPRIHKAFWYHEYAARTYYLDQRWALVCTGLEALIHTDRNGSTAQFTERVPQLASELGLSLSTTDADLAYDLRSGLVHGAAFLSGHADPVLPESQIQLYDRLEDTLRTAVLRAMRDNTFAGILTEDNIRMRWPISRSRRRRR